MKYSVDVRLGAYTVLKMVLFRPNMTLSIELKYSYVIGLGS
jgi:hypothetical protein